MKYYGLGLPPHRRIPKKYQLLLQDILQSHDPHVMAYHEEDLGFPVEVEYNSIPLGVEWELIGARRAHMSSLFSFVKKLLRQRFGDNIYVAKLESDGSLDTSYGLGAELVHVPVELPYVIKIAKKVQEYVELKKYAPEWYLATNNPAGAHVNIPTVLHDYYYVESWFREMFFYVATSILREYSSREVEQMFGRGFNRYAYPPNEYRGRIGHYLNDFLELKGDSDYLTGYSHDRYCWLNWHRTRFEFRLVRFNNWKQFKITLQMVLALTKLYHKWLRSFLKKFKKFWVEDLYEYSEDDVFAKLWRFPNKIHRAKTTKERLRLWTVKELNRLSELIEFMAVEIEGTFNKFLEKQYKKGGM